MDSAVSREKGALLCSSLHPFAGTGACASAVAARVMIVYIRSRTMGKGSPRRRSALAGTSSLKGGLANEGARQKWEKGGGGCCVILHGVFHGARP